MSSLEAQLAQVRIERHGASACQKLAAATVGIAGLGGLGSHIAVALARMGIGHLVIADFDHVDLSNLHRQNYTVAHIGRPKTDALAEQLLAIHPALTLTAHQCRIDADNAADLFSDCDIVCEAFDDPTEKARLVQTLLADCPELRIVAASGMAGSGSANLIQTRRAMSRLYLCGDEESELHIAGHLFAARVALCANHQALMTLRLLLGETTA